MPATEEYTYTEVPGGYKIEIGILQGEYDNGVDDPVWKNVQVDADGNLLTVVGD